MGGVVTKSNHSLFDNIQVVHTRGAILEETNYYPFGLIQQGISSKAAGMLENRIKYNGKEQESKEFSDGSGLELYDFGARMQDPQIGRWMICDPLANKYYSISPYIYTLNNPIKYIDPDGKKVILGGKVDAGLKDLKSILPAGAQKYVSEKNGVVKFDYNKLPKELQKDVGVMALHNLVRAKEQYQYSVSDCAESRQQRINQETGDRIGKPSDRVFSADVTDVANGQFGVASYSKQKYGPDENGKYDVGEPVPVQYDGELTISDRVSWYQKDGDGNDVLQDRSSIVLHELIEIFDWTTGKKTNSEAHEESKDKVKDLPNDDKRKGTKPGTFSKVVIIQ